MDINKSKEAITFEEVKHKLGNKNLEAYSKQNVFERYIVYGSEEELNNPAIQRLLIKHGYGNGDGSEPSGTTEKVQKNLIKNRKHLLFLV